MAVTLPQALPRPNPKPPAVNRSRIESALALIRELAPRDTIEARLMLPIAIVTELTWVVWCPVARRRKPRWQRENGSPHPAPLPLREVKADNQPQSADTGTRCAAGTGAWSASVSTRHTPPIRISAGRKRAL